MWRKYLFAESTGQALDLLSQYAGDARIIAGGTDLVLQSKAGRCPSTVMVDITRIPGLDYVEERGGFLEIGALATQRLVSESPLIQAKAPLLAQACGEMGGPQIRNMATLVGNVINALPAADGAVALFALNAEAQVATQEGQSWHPIEQIYEGVRVCTINSCFEVVTALRFRPLEPHHRSAYRRLTRRRSLALPIVNAAVVAGVRDGRFNEARIAVGPVASTPFRASKAEAALVGQQVTVEAIREAASLVAADSHPRDSHVRGSREYRCAMVEVLVRRGLLEAAGLAWTDKEG